MSTEDEILAAHPELADARQRYLTNTEIIADAQSRTPRGAYDFINGGAETESTLKRNRLGFDQIAFRPRILRDITGTDATTTFLGQKQRIPVFFAPMGGLQRLHPQGAMPVAQAAHDFGIMYMKSTVTEPDMTDIAAAIGEKFLLQIYVHGDDAWIKDVVQRAEAIGCTGIAITVDTANYGLRDRNMINRYAPPGREVRFERPGDEWLAKINWKTIERMREYLTVPLFIKGIATAEDARIAVEHGVEIVYVSNHGGRQLDHGRGAIQVLPEIVDAVEGRAEIVLDSGIVRGSDVIKAVAMGASMVGVGRLQAWALCAAGWVGAYRMLELLELEIFANMKLLGVNSLAELDQSYLHHGAEVVTEPSVLGAFPLLNYERPKSRDEF